MLRCSGEVNVTEYVVSTTIRYTYFHWLIYKLKRSWQKVIRTCHKRGCVRSFHERQKQTESEMRGLILIRLSHLQPENQSHCRCGTSSSCPGHQTPHRCHIVCLLIKYPCLKYQSNLFSNSIEIWHEWIMWRKKNLMGYQTKIHMYWPLFFPSFVLTEPACFIDFKVWKIP